jgi:hypothetical protein
MKEYAEAEAILAAGLQEMIDELLHVRDYSLNAIPEGQLALLDLYKVTNRKAKGMKVLVASWNALEKSGRNQRAVFRGRQNWAWGILNDNPSDAAWLFEQNVRAASGGEERRQALYGLHHAELKLGKLDAALDHARQALEVRTSANGVNHRDFLTGQMEWPSD